MFKGNNKDTRTTCNYKVNGATLLQWMASVKDRVNAAQRVSSCLILATYKRQVDKLKLVEVANQFCFENEYRFSI